MDEEVKVTEGVVAEVQTPNTEAPKEEEKKECCKKGLFDLLDRKQAFWLGIIAGFLVLCTIGFFILLGLVLTGNAGTSTGAKKAPKQFSECLDTGKFADRVSKDAEMGGKLGVQGTPATFINGHLVSGALPYDMIKQAIDAALAGQKMEFDFMKDESGKIPEPATIPELENAIWKGKDDAKVTVVEFSDFECPYCSRFYSTMNQALKEYGDNIRFTYRHFPLSFHANAQKAAEAFECAKDQGKGWEMYDKLFTLSTNKQLGSDAIKQAASELKLK